MQIWPGGCQEELGDGNKEKDRKRERKQHTYGEKERATHTQCLESGELYNINRYL